MPLDSVNDIERLAGLAIVIVVSVGAVLLLLRLSDRSSARRGALVRGYPPDLFPAQDVTSSGALQELAIIQARLLSVAEQLPPHSDMGIWLHAFLRELRQIMDTAYRVAVISRLYGQPARIGQLVEEVRQIEQEVVAHVVQRLLDGESDAQNELLEGRLAALRLCVRELAGMAEQPA